jgi:glucose-6-phosphate isomerase
VSEGSPLWIAHADLEIALDAHWLGITASGLDGLQWARVFGEMAELERGGMANADEGRQVGHYWLRAPHLAPTDLQRDAIRSSVDAVSAFARDVRSGELRVDGSRFTDLLLVGIGGSALGPQLLLDALASDDGLAPSFLDNTDPNGIARVLGRLGDRLATTLVVVVSKSGGTPETANGAALAIDRLRKASLDPASRLVAVTQEGSTLDQQAAREGWLRRFPMWDWVGGRTSVTSAVGLLPAALAGVDTDALLRGAAAMDAWTRAANWRENPAAVLAGGWFLLGNGRGDRNLVVLPYCDRLLLLSRYLQQLIMESIGKRLDRHGQPVYQGLSVFGNKGSTDQHSFVQQLRDGRNDFSALFVQVLEDGPEPGPEISDGVNAGDYLQGFLLGTRRALYEEGRPNAVLTLPRVSAFELGAVVALFERAVGLYGSLIDVNAYHQPGVEAGKRAAIAILALAQRVRGRLGPEPVSAATLAAQLEADELEVRHVLARLAATGRARVTGGGPTATYAAVSG